MQDAARACLLAASSKLKFFVLLGGFASTFNPDFAPFFPLEVYPKAAENASAPPHPRAPAPAPRTGSASQRAPTLSQRAPGGRRAHSGVSYHRRKWRGEEKKQRSHVHIRRKKSLSLFFIAFLLSLSTGSREGEGRGAKLYSNCGGEVRMIASYCPLSPQVSAKTVLCILHRGEGEGGDKAMQRRGPLL